MEEIDEFRIKVLTRLGQDHGRRVPILDIISNEVFQVKRMVIMRDLGWIGVLTTKRGIKYVWITREGQRVLKAFERIYR